MTLICLTLVLSLFLFLAAPALTGWAEGYLALRARYDVQISTSYNNVYEESDLPAGEDYELVSAFLKHTGSRKERLHLPSLPAPQGRIPQSHKMGFSGSGDLSFRL